MLDVLFVLVGFALIVAVLDSALRTFVLPRGVTTPLTRVVFQGLRGIFNLVAKAAKSYEGRDRVMALYGPVGLFALVFVWVVLILAGYGLIYFGVDEVRTWREAFELSGSSFFTLGFVVPPHDLGSFLLVFTEAGVGLAVLALLIAYLPTIYGAFSRRELAVARLAARAGTPPSGVELVERYHLINWLEELPELWERWEEWFAEVAETHTSLAVLVFFRSPNPHRSWVTASGAVMDAAALAQSTVAVPWSPQAGLCIRAGYLALREIADSYNIPYDPDPSKDDPISIDRSEFDEAYDRLKASGVPVRPERDSAWEEFAGWRVNYDNVLLALASLTMAPYAPWSSDRSMRYRRPSLRRPRAPGAS